MQNLAIGSRAHLIWDSPFGGGPIAHGQISLDCLQKACCQVPLFEALFRPTDLVVVKSPVGASTFSH